MANTQKDITNLTKGQARAINKRNRNISGNINSLMDNLNSMAYGIQKSDKIESLVSDFNSLLSSEISTMTKITDGDTTSFITKLFSENNKRLAGAAKDIESMFNANEGQLEAFINEQYRNRLIKQSDLHEIASQLVELREAITITRDAIISADIIDGHMSRDIKIKDESMNNRTSNDYLPIIKTIEDKFDLQSKIKNFIIPKSLEYGEYYVYCVPYSKIFEDFSKEKNGIGGKQYSAYTESEGTTLYEFVKDRDKKSLEKSIIEYVKESKSQSELLQPDVNSAINNIPKELDEYLKNISVSNEAIPLPILEEGVESYREYYHEFVEKTMTEAPTNNDKSISFDAVMKDVINVDGAGIHGTGNIKSSKAESFSNVKDCYLKLIDPTHLLPIEIMDEVIGYYYIQEEDITPLSGILTSTVYYSKFDNNRNENNVLSAIAETIVAAFDKKFLDKNIKFKRLIVEALNYYKINNRKIKFQFIPKDYIISFKVNEDENGKGVSILEPSLFYAKLYLMILLFKIMTIILNSNDMKVNYIKQSGIEKDVSNKIQEIARKKQQRQITMTDMFSYTTLINKIGQGSEMYIPVGKSGERGIETEILSGQDVQLNSDLLEMLKKAYISGTGVPDVLMNYINEADFAKTLELANNRFQGRVVSLQLDYNKQITKLYRAILKYTNNSIPESIIESVEFNFIQPKFSNSNITNDLLNNHNSLQDFLVLLYFGQDGIDDPNNAPKIKRFKKALAEQRLSMLNFAEFDKMYKECNIAGEEEALNPANNNDNEQ